jgi:hypothetical protein
MDKLTQADCLDVAHFRMLLKQDRRSDDNLKHRLNSINTNDYRQCAQLAGWLAEMHRARRAALSNCLNLVESSGGVGKQDVKGKEVTLLRGEAVVEDIVEEQSWALVHEKCRVLGDIERYKAMVMLNKK